MTTKRIVKVVVGLVAVLLIFAAFRSWRTHRQFERWVDSARERELPVVLTDLEPVDVVAEDNGATYLARVRDDSHQLVAELGDYVPGARDFDWGQGLTADQIQRLERGFESYPRIMPELKRAASCSQFAWPLDYSVSASKFIESYIEIANGLRDFATVSDYRARYLDATGSPDLAVTTYLQQLQRCRLQDQEPLLIGFLVNTACRMKVILGINGLLQTATLSGTTHEAIERELAEHDAMTGLMHAIRTEVAVGLESFREFPNALGQMNSDRSSYLKLIDQQLEMGTQSHYQLADVKPVQTSGIAASLVPALDAARESMNRTRAQIRCLRVLNVLVQRGSGAKADLGKLGLPPEAIIDPYTGELLLVSGSPKGWTVYSVGEDRVDGGGDFLSHADLGFGPP